MPIFEAWYPLMYPQMALTDTAVRNAKPKEKPYKLGDSGGAVRDRAPKWEQVVAV